MSFFGDAPMLPWAIRKDKGVPVATTLCRDGSKDDIGRRAPTIAVLALRLYSFEFWLLFRILREIPNFGVAPSTDDRFGPRRDEANNDNAEANERYTPQRKNLFLLIALITKI